MAGYIGSQTPVVSNGSQRKYTFTATAAQTVFTGMDIPNPQQIQVFQNGVRLVITTDYTVSSGTTVTLVNAASAGDSLVVILFADYQLLDTDALTFTGGTTIEGDLTVDTNTLYVDSTNNRVGIGTTSTVAQSKMTIAGNSLSITGFDNGFTSGGNRAMIDFGANYMRLGGLTGGGSTVNGIKFITPAGGDAAILDSDGLKFNGDTAAANALDDYEEGTFTPTSKTNAGTPATFGNSVGQYTKIGNVVYFNMDIIDINTTGTTFNSQLQIDGLPFTVDVDSTRATVLWDNITFQSTRTSCGATISTSEFIQINSLGTGIADTPVDYGDLNSGVTDVFISGFYYTNQ